MGTDWKNKIAMVIQKPQPKTLSFLESSLKPLVSALLTTPITSFPNGKIISAYGDDTWDFRTFLHANKAEGIIYFNKEPYLSNPGLLKDVKHLLWTLINRQLDIKKIHSITSYTRWSSVLHCISEYCVKEEVSIATFLTHDGICLNFLQKFCPQPRKKTAESIIKNLFSIPTNQLGCIMFDAYNIKFGKETSDTQEEQTLVIPSRLLCLCIRTTKKIITDFTTHASKIKRLTLKLHKECKKYSGIDHYLTSAKISPIRFNRLIEEYGLRALSVNYGWNNAVSFGRYLSEVQFASKTLIHIYSGMRDDEAYSLLPGCLCEETVDGHLGYWLHGITTKGYRRRQPAAWVTSIDVRPAIEACETLCKWIKLACNIDGALPLFSNISYFAFSISHNRTQFDIKGQKLANLTHITFNRLFKTPAFVILENDYTEIKYIEYARNWELEDTYIEGMHWNFTTHQFRRSLAYYGIESGLIRFSSLHEQLQHIRMRMTTHYSKGGTAAMSLIGNSSAHFQYEYKKITTIVRALDYVKTILLSEERLIGGHGKHIENNIKPLGKEQILMNRQKTVEQMQAGLIAYTPRATGGCVNPSPCHRHLLQPLTACIGCAHAALSPARIRLAISTFNGFLLTLLKNSPEYISAKSELNIITEHFSHLNLSL